MDLFDAYPQLADRDVTVLRGRSLRLIALAGIVYDDEAFYFELGQQRHWGRLPSGEAAIGVGTPTVYPEGIAPLHHTLIRHVRKSWRCQVELYPAGHSYLVTEVGEVDVLTDVEAHVPYILVFTPPRLGGAEVPDALVQAVYLLPVKNPSVRAVSPGLLKIERVALTKFLEPESWLLQDIEQRPWAALYSDRPLPPDARLRPVLALRGIRRLWEADLLPGVWTT